MPPGRTPTWHRRPEAPSPCAAGSLRSRSPALAIDTTRHDSITSHAPTNSVSQNVDNAEEPWVPTGGFDVTWQHNL